MSLSDLTRRLVLEAMQEQPDGCGGFVQSWTALGSHWARISSARGRDQSSGNLALGVVANEITVRGAPLGSPARPIAGQRFREGGRIWRIIAVREVDQVGCYLCCDTIEERVP